MDVKEYVMVNQPLDNLGIQIFDQPDEWHVNFYA